MTDHVALLVFADRRQAGSQRARFSAMGGGQEKDAVPVRAQTSELHDLAAAGQRRQREPIRDPLAERAEVGLDPIAGLRAA
jgi:hypothetical protein